MANPRISNILIGVLLVGLISLAIAGFIGKGSVDYGVSGYNDSTLQLMVSSADDINSIANETNSKLGTANADGSATGDIFGSFFLKAWQSFKTLGKSIGIFFKMVVSGVGNIPYIGGVFGNMLVNVLLGIITIIIIIGIFLHFIKNSDRL